MKIQKKVMIFQARVIWNRIIDRMNESNAANCNIVFPRIKNFELVRARQCPFQFLVSFGGIDRCQIKILASFGEIDYALIAPKRQRTVRKDHWSSLD